MLEPKIKLDEPPKQAKKKQLTAILLYYLIFVPLAVICFIIEGKSAIALLVPLIIPGISYLMLRKKYFWSKAEIVYYAVGAYLLLFIGIIGTVIHFVLALKQI